jgi:hypothetical protein
MAIRGDGGSCTDPFNPVATAMRAGEKIALFLPHRMQARIDLLVPEVADITTDWFHASVRQEEGGEHFFNPLFSLPPLGTCAAYGSTAEESGPRWVRRFLDSAQLLDAGDMLRLMGGSQERVLERLAIARVFAALLGKDTAPALFPSLFFTSANYTLSLPGGPAVGALQAAFGALRSVTWTNRDDAAVVDRTKPLRVTWNGGNTAEDIVLVAGVARIEGVNAGAQFLCTAAADAGSLSVPPEVLQALPPSPGRAWDVPAEVMVINSRLRAPIPVAGMGVDHGYVVSSIGSLKSVVVE